MPSIRRSQISASLALCLAVLLAACAPQTALPESPQETSAPAVEGAPSVLPPSPTMPASPTAEPTSAPTSPPSPTAAPASSPDPIRLTPVVPVVPQPVPISPQEPAIGEVPQELLEAILQDAEERTGVDGAAITLLRAEAVTWSDGSLGCPQPGMEYIQVLVPGYRIVLAAGGRELDYHASEGGFFLLCEHSLHQETLP